MKKLFISCPMKGRYKHVVQDIDVAESYMALGIMR